mmetsp:Transcript_11547/g.21900  ORF Transcript_11547/g.21900 Transcript_11547/m.21900 type:complete len:229 (+) Transcript_11547:842-1528(+)
MLRSPLSPFFCEKPSPLVQLLCAPPQAGRWLPPSRLCRCAPRAGGLRSPTADALGGRAPSPSTRASPPRLAVENPSTAWPDSPPAPRTRALVGVTSPRFCPCQRAGPPARVSDPGWCSAAPPAQPWPECALECIAPSLALPSRGARACPPAPSPGRLSTRRARWPRPRPRRQPPPPCAAPQPAASACESTPCRAPPWPPAGTGRPRGAADGLVATAARRPPAAARASR